MQVACSIDSFSAELIQFFVFDSLSSLLSVRTRAHFFAPSQESVQEVQCKKMADNVKNLDSFNKIMLLAELNSSSESEDSKVIMK